MGELEKEFPEQDLINEFMHLDVDRMVAKLGAKGVAETFLRAQKVYLENPNKEPAENRAMPMTVQAWSEAYACAEGEEFWEGEEEEFWEGDEEECYDEELKEEVEEEQEGEVAEEPVAKKAKT